MSDELGEDHELSLKLTKSEGACSTQGERRRREIKEEIQTTSMCVSELNSLQWEVASCSIVSRSTESM